MRKAAISRRATSAFAGLALAAATLLGTFAAPAAKAQNPIPPIETPNVPPPDQNPQGHRLKSDVDLVVLHVTVTDEKGEFVENLNRNEFQVFEDKIQQNVSMFSRDDIPVTMGLVIDNSGSMREKRAQVNAAALTFVQTSNPQDEAFVVNFNDEFYLDTEGDFTSDQRNLQDALARIDTRGSTALYDAVIGSLGHLKKGHKDKRVLLVITDGDDDASRMSFEDTVKSAEESNATIYTIGVFSQDDMKNDKKMVRHSKKVLTELADATGGEAYFPANLDEVTPICEQVAHEIRNQYTIGYYPTNGSRDGTFRSVQVRVFPPKGLGKINVRTRTGYYAPKPSANAD
ncbi:MAG TPA: VWA domain-containing protein [Candidatus Baltobacteraceae bacterium]|nr:VWA domain-containing protein [Candidatus Baltobacteraceae bacterium]